jgi:hypothetical protein
MIEVSVREHSGIDAIFFHKLKVRSGFEALMFGVHARIEHNAGFSGIDQIRIGTNSSVPTQTFENHRIIVLTGHRL